MARLKWAVQPARSSGSEHSCACRGNLACRASFALPETARQGGPIIRGSDSCTNVPCVALAWHVRSFQTPQSRQRNAKRTLASTCEPRWKPSTTNVPGSPRIRSRRFDSCWFWMFTWPTLTITSPALTCIRTRDVRCLRRVPLGLAQKREIFSPIPTKGACQQQAATRQ
jgi:hypothetical protein